MPTDLELTAQISQRLQARNQLIESFFAAESLRLAEACREMSERFLRGGRLLAFGRGPYATDAQHVSVEFVHPVIVGKRALPALDLSLAFEPWLKTLVQADDIVMGFGPPQGDPLVWASLDAASQTGAMTFALPGAEGSYFYRPATQDAFIHQELIEIENRMLAIEVQCKNCKNQRHLDSVIWIEAVEAVEAVADDLRRLIEMARERGAR